MEITSVEPLRGGKWNLARVGIEEDGSRLLSKGRRILTKNLLLIDRANGETFSLLPGQPGDVYESHFISNEIGPIDSGQRYNRYGKSSLSSEEQNPTYYLIIVGNGNRSKALYAGSLEDKDTVQLGDPYDSILHMDILENDQLAVYASRQTKTFRAVFDLTSFSEVEEKVVEP